MIRRGVFLFIFISSLFFANAYENVFFRKLSLKELATFNDAITLMRILYDEEEDTDVYIENILWAAGKKLFQVTIPIKPDFINPVITRKEFAYWLCKVFDFTGSDKADSKRVELNRYSAYRQCVALGILHPGRGGDDTFTGVELLDTFSYLDYYVRYFKIIPREGELEFQKTDYDDLPEWRKILYKELDEQRKREKELKNNFRKINKLKSDENKEKKGDDKIREKFIDDASDDSL